MASSSRIAVHYHPTRVSGAILGMLVFLAGIALVVSVFLMARGLFDAPPPLIPAAAFPTPSPSPPSSVKAVADASPAAPAATIVIGQALALFLEKLLLLLIMCVAGSVIASSGIHLFFKALAAPQTVQSESLSPPPAPQP